MGVRRAMDSALSEARKGKGPLCTLGPLIHNRQAVEMLEARGIRVIDSIDGLTGSTVIIRAHGIPPETHQALEQADVQIVDATCPHVRYSQNIVRKRHKEGARIVIACDKDHAEVVALLGFCNYEGVVVTTPDEARGLRLEGPVCLIAQTTFNESVFHEIAEIISAAHGSVEAVDTICRSTEERQREVVELCESVDAMVVVGGKHSANTRRLAEIARASGTHTVHVETASDLPADLAQYGNIGVTAGASKPNWITAAVMSQLDEIGKATSKTSHALHHGLKFLTDSTLYTGLAAVALTQAGFALQSRVSAAPDAIYLAIAFCYIFSVHIWNRTRGRRLDKLNAPARVAFYARHPKLFVGLTTLLAALSLLLAAKIGMAEALLLLAAYVIGLAYNASLAPLGLKHRRLSDLPASKDFFTATGWAAVAVVIPAISPAQQHSVVALALATAVAFILAFVRSAMFDFTDIQGDRLLGRETLPVWLGSHRTRAYLAILAMLLAGILVAGAALGVFSTLGYWLLPCPVFILLVLFPFFPRVVRGNIICPLVADGFLVLAGVIALLWQVIR